MTKFPDPASGEWHLDKRVPVAVILTLLANIVASVAWLSALGTRVGYLENSITLSSELREDVTTMKEQIKGMDRILVRLEAYLDRDQARKEDRQLRREGSQ